MENQSPLFTAQEMLTMWETILINVNGSPKTYPMDKHEDVSSVISKIRKFTTEENGRVSFIP